MRALFIVLALFVSIGFHSIWALAEVPWNSLNRYRVLLSVEPGRAGRTYSPASIDVDLTEALRAMGEKGKLDEDTIEVVAYDDSARPRVFDDSREAEERCLLPWRIDKYYGVSRATLNFVVPDSTCRQYALYFDTTESGRGQPRRLLGMVGDGDLFREGYQRCQIAASKMDDLCDMDGDGDLDLFKVTNEPFIYCYENVGGNHFVDRGRLTWAGELFILPHDGSFRSWAALRFDDWDGDGDQDLFVGFTTGDAAHQYQFFIYENTAGRGNPPAFKDHGPLKTSSGHPLGSFWFATMAIVDWDGDGKKDILASHLSKETLGPLNDHHRVFFYRNKSSRPWSFELDEGVKLMADGQDVVSFSPRVEVADIDGDGDFELFCAPQGGPLHWWKNVGTRTDPKLTAAGALVEKAGGHSGIEVADFTGDGLPDCLIGDMWGGGPVPGKPSPHTCLLKNVGTRAEPRFQEVDAEHGAPYTEGFQPCNMGRQNTVRVADWDNDGRCDLIASSGHVYLYRNLTSQLSPLFAAGQDLVTDAGSASLRSDIADWNNDGRKDLLVVSGDGELRLYLNEGTHAQPKLAAARRIEVSGKPIKGAVWASVLVCDWDKDGKKDLLLGAGGWVNADSNGPLPLNNKGGSQDRGFLFCKNTGSDAEPVLRATKWLTADDKVIEYIRPNLGSYVDWNGDGREDFISCEFENNIWLYLNRAATAANAEPQLAAGMPIIQPSTVQMVSGVCALDWNRDGDVDIVTGQGHGGSGLRFFERDYIEDTLRKTHPAVTVQGHERKDR